MDELLSDFVAEAREMLAALAGEIVAWEADPSDRARLDAIFRFFHTVKGNCGFFDFARLEALSHAAEDALSEVRAARRVPDAAFVNAVLAVIDRIAWMIEAIDSGEDISTADDSELIAELAGASEGSGEIAIGAEPSGDVGFANRSAGALRSVRLPIELLDWVMSGVSDMVLARNELARRIGDLPEGVGLEGPFNRLSSILADVRDAITRTRMQRIETLFTGFPRLVRDLAGELGKQVLVEIEGGDVELDREMIEIIRDPLVHIIRNSIDHGIECPADRRAAGKREIGLLRIAARQTGNQIQIAVSDDGRGIDGDALVAKAVASGTLGSDEAERLTAAEKILLVCEPGLSTADKITAVSGRGVGMDVVRANIERVGGNLAIHSTPGLETRIMLSLPLTLSIVPALTVQVGDQRFAIPRSYVEEIFHVDPAGANLLRAGGRTFLKVRDGRVACADLGATLGMAATPIKGGRCMVLVRLTIGDPFAIAVDQALDHHDLVVKPIAPVVMQTGLYVGTTQLEDGSPILMLDMGAVGQLAGLTGEAEGRARRAVRDEANEDQTAGEVPVLLFIDLKGRRRAVRVGVVKRYEEVDAAAIGCEDGNAHVVIDGAILPLAGLDGEALPKGPLEVLRLEDGTSEVVFAIDRVIDSSAYSGALTAAEGRDLVAGLTLIDGQAVEVLDPLAVFARFGAQAAPARQPVCRIPAQDAWMQDFLRPIIEGAGYLVVDERAGEEADVSISLDDANGDEAGQPDSAPIVRLRSTPQADPGGEGSIYRYDRQAVLDALKAARVRRSA